MATIVVHKETQHRFVLLGAGFGIWATSVPGMFLGSASPNRESGTTGMLAVADATGAVTWFPYDAVTVVTVDGKTPHELLNPAPPYR